jgi:hypothetical protein
LFKPRSCLAKPAVFTFLAATLVTAVLGSGAAQAAGPDYPQYQIAFPIPFPTNGPQAFTSLEERAIRALTAVACGAELEFFESSPNGRMTAIVAKMDWWGGHRLTRGSPSRITETICRATETRSKPATWPDNDWEALAQSNVAGVNGRLAGEFGGACGAVDEHGTAIKGIVDSAEVVEPGQSGAADDVLRLQYTVTRDCLKAQINATIAKMIVVGSMGTDGLSCMQIGPKRQGDWDQSLIELIRMAYLQDRYFVLDWPTSEKLRNDLLTTDGPPADESYPLTGCGNTEESTGTAQERADNRHHVEEVLDDLGEAYSLLWFLLFLVAAIAVTLMLLGGGVAGGFLANVGLAALGGSAALAALIAQTNIPETENHLLMINSTKYLNNQFVIRDLGAGSDVAKPYEEDQEDLKEFFLEKAKDFLSEEFIEYNSRPYARLSLAAFFNLFDFAEDQDVKRAAQMVLDFSFAKFAVGSHEGRRFVPFRRKREYLRVSIEEPIDPQRHTGLFDLGEGADHLIAIGLLYAGQVQQLSGGQFSKGQISRGAAHEMVRPATSAYRPEEFVIDLAVRKQEIFQRLKHDGAEIYSSGPGFLISGGGITSDLAYSGSGIDEVDLAWKRDFIDDLGTALPTTILLSGTPDRTTLDSVLRIQGERSDEGKFRTYDHNLCVWKGFACGMNIAVPQELESCLRLHSPARPEWRFLDTAACPFFSGVGTPTVPRLFIAVCRQGCPTGVSGCNVGLVEVVPAGNETFFAFADRIMTQNPPGFFSGTSGTYHSARNQKISFKVDAHQEDSDEWGIESVDGDEQEELGDWDFAEGDVLNGKGDGRVTIRNSLMNRTLDLDLRDEDAPKRSIN